MSLSDYLTEPITPYIKTNSGTKYAPDYVWTAQDVIYVYWETADGRSAVTDQNTEVRADMNMICNIGDIVDYEARFLFSDDEIYEIAFIDHDAANRSSHAEILLKRMPAGTKSEMGIS